MSVISDSKMGITKGNGNMSSWPKTNPQSYKPESAPAKPGGSGGGAMANKTAYSTSINKGIVANVKSRY